MSTFCLLAYTALFILDTFLLADFRSMWRIVSGELFEGEQWGFGQTTTVLLWAPFVWTVVRSSIGMFIGCLGRFVADGNRVLEGSSAKGSG
jgi:hypothetical protein